MIKPEKNFLITGFFTRYIGWIIKRHFHQVVVNQPDFDNGKSVLLVANHFSWWDGFLLFRVNKMVFKKRFHIMVLEDSMRKLSFLKYVGSFSVAKNSKRVLQSIDYAAGLLADPGNLVVIFPQGKLYSNFVGEVNFEQGVARIAAKAQNNFQYVLAASFVENFEHKKPTAHIYLDALSVNDVQPQQLAGRYQQYYQTAKAQQTNIVV